MDEPQAGPPGSSGVSSSGNNGNKSSAKVDRLYYDELTDTIELAAERLEEYLTTVQLCKRQLTSRHFDADNDGPLLESAFLGETVRYIDTMYTDTHVLERAQEELGMMVEGCTEHWEELPSSRTTRAHIRHSREVVGRWFANLPVFGKRSGDKKGGGADKNVEGVLEEATGGGGGGGGEVHLAIEEVVSGGEVPGEVVVAVEEGETEVAVVEDGNDELKSQSTMEDGDGNGNSNGDSWNGNGNNSGNGISNAERSGNGTSESQETSLIKYKPTSYYRRAVTRESDLLLHEMYRQNGILRRELLRHIDCLWFLTRVRHQKDGGGSLVERLARTLAAIEQEMAVAQLEVARRAEAVHRFGEEMWPPQQLEPPLTPSTHSTPSAASTPPTPPPTPPPPTQPPPPPPEEIPLELVPVQIQQPAGGFFQRLIGRIWYTFIECIPQRRNFRW